ncbi:LacI family DNA-binding transcriptional regulator [Deinococcus aquiradiocola]|nr:LacI family DNA-binding transcriptional regulator [Deinococcus aquiradiocola]
MADVAREAGVSTATVSFVLNNTKAVTPAVQARVEAAVQALGYRPSHAAQALRTGRSLALGLIIPDLTNPFFPKLAQDIEQEARTRGYAVLLADSHDDPALQQEHLGTLAQRGVDVLLVVPAVGTDDTLTADVPLIAIDRAAGDTPLVHSDKRQGGQIAAQHLLDLGHREFAVLAGPSRHGGVGERVRGMLGTLERAGVPVRKGRIYESDYSLLAGREGARHLLQTAPGFTALLAANDTLALGALSALTEAGITVPGQVSLVGFDDIPWSALSAPSLTTVRQDTRQMARQAIELALQTVNAPQVAPLPVGTTLTVRGSTAPVTTPGPLPPGPLPDPGHRPLENA